MKTQDEAKLKRCIRKMVVKYDAIDDVLITDLIDWVRISEKAKEELQEGIKDGSMSWQTLTTIAMASKQIQNIMQRLNITPEKRAKQKEQPKSSFDLDNFLNS